MEHVPLTGEETVEAVENVHLTQLAVGENMSVQHFRIEPGATVPKHKHHHEQSGFVYRGELTFILEDGSKIVVGEGESFLLESNEEHAAENRGDIPVEGVDIFDPPRPAPDWDE